MVTAIVTVALLALWSPAAMAKPIKPANDNIERATKIATLLFTDSIDTSKATSSRGDPKDCGSNNNSVWYFLKTSTDMAVGMGTSGSNYITNVAVYTGTREHLTQVACGTYGTSFHAGPGQSYYVKVANASGDGGHLVFSVASHIPPPNDDFGNVAVIPALPFSKTLDTVAATSAADDPANCGGIARNSVWYAFTPAASITIVADTQASEYAANIGVYTGRRGALNPVACGFRKLSFSVTAGVTYYLMVTINNGEGNLTLNIADYRPPVNDNIGSGTAISSLPFVNSVDTRGATTASGEPGACGNMHSVWYVIRPTASQMIALDTIGSSYGTQIGVFAGAPNTLTMVACGGNNGVSFTATAGVTYYIQVVGDGGDLLFNAVGHLPAPNDNFDNATVIVNLPYTDNLDTAAATVAPDDHTDCAGTNVHTVWYAITPSTNVSLTADTSQSNYQAVVCVYTGSRIALSRVASGFQQVSFQPTAGITYFFMFADYAYFGSGGHLVFQLR
jgi:hypothetical protein